MSSTGKWLSILMVGLPLFAQPETIPFPLITSTTQLVQVTVIATGHKGILINNLTKEDFKIFEQGQLRRTAAFSSNVNTRQTTVPVPQLHIGSVSNQSDKQRNGGVSIVLLDKTDTDSFHWTRGLSQISNVLSVLSVNTSLAVYLLEPRNGLEVIQDYGENKHDLRKSLERWLNPPLDSAPSSETQEMPQLSFSKRDPNLQTPEFLSLGHIQGLIDALKVIADHVADLPGRKSLIWFASNFPNTFTALPTRHDDLSDLQRFQMLRALNSLIAADVAIYPVDARGLIPDHSFDAENQDIGIGPVFPGQLNSLHMPEFWSELELARRSGGRAFINTNGFAQSMQEAAGSEKAGYTLGFYTDRKPDDQYHKLLVKVKNKGVMLRYRPGYWDFSAQPSSGQSITTDLKRTLISPFLEQALQVEATPSFSGNPPQKLDVTLYISTGNLLITSEKKANVARLDVIFGQKDATGRTFAIPPYRVICPCCQID